MPKVIIFQDFNIKIPFISNSGFITWNPTDGFQTNNLGINSSNTNDLLGEFHETDSPTDPSIGS
jgi:hypothetical protein